MKNTFKYTIICLMAIAASCQKAELADNLPESGNAGEDIMFVCRTPVSKVNAGTDRNGLLNISWSEQDQIGIFRKTGESFTENNYPYKAVPDTKDKAQASFLPADPRQSLKHTESEGQSFFSYFPYAKKNIDAESVAFVSDAKVSISEKDPLRNIADNGFWISGPVHMSRDMSEISLSYENLFSVIEFRYKLGDEDARQSVILTGLSLASEERYIAGEGTIDITGPLNGAGTPITFTAGSRTIEVQFEEERKIGKDGYMSVYLSVAPGIYKAGTLAMNVTARDYSVHTFTFDKDITLVPNRHYVHSFSLNTDEFVQSEPYEVTLPELTCKVGEDFTIGFSGPVESIEMWSGDKGHDYEYHDKDRTDYPVNVEMNFKMALQSGYQRHPMTVMYSYDFSGEMTHQAIKAATWYGEEKGGISEKFNWSEFIYDSKNQKGSEETTKFNIAAEPHDCGTASFPEKIQNPEKGIYIAFHYHVDTKDNEWMDPVIEEVVGNGRTFFYLYDYNVSAVYPNSEKEVLISELRWERTAKDNNGFYNTSTAVDYPTPVFVRDEESAMKTVLKQRVNFMTKASGNEKYPHIMKFGSEFSPKEDKDSWLILPKLTFKPQIVGKDSPIIIKTGKDECPSDFTYIFSEPGTYNLIIFSTVRGMEKDEVIKTEATVTVTE